MTELKLNLGAQKKMSVILRKINEIIYPSLHHAFCHFAVKRTGCHIGSTYSLALLNVHIQVDYITENHIGNILGGR